MGLGIKYLLTASTGSRQVMCINMFPKLASIIIPLVTNGYYSTRQLCNNFKEHRVLSVHCKKLLEVLAWISAFRRKKLYLFTMYTTHFRIFQSLKIKIFQDNSVHCCHTLLKINKYKSYYLGNYTS